MMKKYLPWIITLIVIMGYGFLLLPTEKEKPSSQQEKNIPEVEIKGSDFKHYIDEKSELIIHSKEVKLYKTENKVVFGKNTGELRENKKKTLTFSGENGVFYLDSKNIHLQGSVVAESVAGETLQADQLDYQAAKDVLTGKGNIVFCQEDKTVYGDSFITDTALNRIEVIGHAKVTMGGK